MRKVVVFMTMSLDGFVAGPNNELDWMVPTPGRELTDDTIAFLKQFNTGFMGYPTGVGMMAYWAGVAQNATAAEGERAIAEVVNKMHPILVSTKPEKLESNNAELLVAKDDNALVEAVTRLKQEPGGDLGLPGGVRTAQKFARLGLADEYALEVHPITLGHGKPLFTSKVSLELVSARTYRSGVMRLLYRARQTPA